jgi:[acyl-carrier-protein] S-malonyltransferase
MAALLGVELGAVEEICAEAAQGEVVGVANINSPGQIAIAGHRAAVERAVTSAAARGGRKSVMLPVSAPFHCALMKPAADRLAGELERVAVRAPAVPVVRNVDAGLTTTAEEIKPFLVRQVASPVRWTACLQRLAREGAGAFVEVGPGRVLSGLVKRTLDGARGLNVEDPDSLAKTLAELSAGGR